MKLQADRGNAAVEFIVVAVFLLIPICYSAIACASAVNEYLTVNSAARNGAREFVLQADETSARAAALAQVRQQLAHAKLGNTTYSIQITCTEHPCFMPDGFVTLQVKGKRKFSVPLLGSVQIPISATQTLAIDTLR